MTAVNLQFLKDEIAPFFIVIALVGGYVFQVIGNGMVPEEFKTLVTAVVVFYFTQKGQQVAFKNGAGQKLTSEALNTTVAKIVDAHETAFNALIENAKTPSTID